MSFFRLFVVLFMNQLGCLRLLYPLYNCIYTRCMVAIPVVSIVGTPEYQLANYLDNLITPHIPDTYVYAKIH